MVLISLSKFKLFERMKSFRDNLVVNTLTGSNFMIAFNTFYYSWSSYASCAEYDFMLRYIVKTMIYPLLLSPCMSKSKNAASGFLAILDLATLISSLIAAFLSV